jgi:hypothetical protein
MHVFGQILEITFSANARMLMDWGQTGIIENLKNIQWLFSASF